MKKRTLATLHFLRLVDDQNRLSLTNIALIVMVGSLASRPEIQMQDLMAFGAAIASYQFKRWAQPDAKIDETEELRKTLADMQTKIASLQLNATMRK